MGKSPINLQTGNEKAGNTASTDIIKEINKENNRDISTGTLAFLGDAVFELYVRERLVGIGDYSSDKMHVEAVKYVRAESQARIIKELMPELTEEETALVKRARNHKMPNRSRSAGMVDYKLATGLEALIGKLYMDGERRRLEELMNRAFTIIEEGKKHE